MPKLLLAAAVSTTVLLGFGASAAVAAPPGESGWSSDDAHSARSPASEPMPCRRRRRIRATFLGRQWFWAVHRGTDNGIYFARITPATPTTGGNLPPVTWQRIPNVTTSDTPRIMEIGGDFMVGYRAASSDDIDTITGNINRINAGSATACRGNINTELHSPKGRASPTSPAFRRLRTTATIA
jgi:hypothetical protein